MTAGRFAAELAAITELLTELEALVTSAIVVGDTDRYALEALAADLRGAVKEWS